jgi:hypothetical protein
VLVESKLSPHLVDDTPGARRQMPLDGAPLNSQDAIGELVGRQVLPANQQGVLGRGGDPRKPATGVPCT